MNQTVQLNFDTPSVALNPVCFTKLHQLEASLSYIKVI